jgi:LemA protein
MQEQPTPRLNQATRRFSDNEAQEIYKRAAQIESKTLFSDENDMLSRTQLEDAANRAGISDKAVEAAIAQIERERQEATVQAVAKSKTRRQVMIAGGVVLALLATNGILTQRGFSSRLAEVEAYKANVETALQRRQNLVPNVLALVKENLSNQRDLIAALNRTNVDTGTFHRAIELLKTKKIDDESLDVLEGAENRISQTQYQLNQKVGEYNRNASSFPASAWRPVFGFPARIEPFAAEKSAQVAPKF